MPMIHDKAVRGRTDMGWLDSFHTFSFGHFNDPARMGHRALRVINEDRVIPGAGFGTHPHADMDILTYVISGALRHEDSMGNGSIIRPGEVQHMSAGTGVMHSEMNASDTDPVHFLQIWIMPDKRGIKPSYDQRSIDQDAMRNQFGLIAGPMPQDDAIALASDTSLYVARLDDGQTATHSFAKGRAGFLQVTDGIVEVQGERFSAGDGLQFDDIDLLKVTAHSEAEILLFDLA
ncbi:pirin family protein [Parasulfitobacter algicola]|uniref:Pirin family protein n=1 Tax=Parasulfitobacter algicola TaxID=2614809 RepID=A0ABX2ITM6_9RHOB|nr:pirin family protein [Sulfitobacter algicola]NSX53631.1 pirin family protein [Sulfitobacter algicola]